MVEIWVWVEGALTPQFVHYFPTHIIFMCGPFGPIYLLFIFNKMSVTAHQKRENPTKQPAQHSQPSRKGKKAWRKHVDIGDVEKGLEELRTEERVTGCVIWVI